MKGFFVLVLIILVAAYIYPLRNGGSICDAAREEVVQQIPYVLDILAARHPVIVGLPRSEYQAEVDQFAQAYVRAWMQSKQNPGMINCYSLYYYIMFNKDEVRKAMADELEKDLGLN